MEDNVVMKTLSKQFHIYIKYLRSDQCPNSQLDLMKR